MWAQTRASSTAAVISVVVIELPHHALVVLTLNLF